MGYRIAKEPFTEQQKADLAASGLGKDNVNPAIKFFTDMLFKWGGGDNASRYYTDKNGEGQTVSGALDWNPSKIEHLISGYFGGTGQFMSDLVTTAFQALAPEQEVDFRNAPFVNAFIKKTPEAKWKVIREYYELKDGLDGFDERKRQYWNQTMESGDPNSEGANQYKKTVSKNYYQAYKATLDIYDGVIDSYSERVNYKTGEGTDKVVKSMQDAIDAINELKKEYNVK